MASTSTRVSAAQYDVFDLVVAVADGTLDDVGEIAKRLAPWA